MSALFIQGWQFLRYSYKAGNVCTIYKAGNVCAIHKRKGVEREVGSVNRMMSINGKAPVQDISHQRRFAPRTFRTHLQDVSPPSP